MIRPSMIRPLMVKWASIFVCTVWLAHAVLAAEPLAFGSAEEETRFKELTEELRCLVCQNQSLSDSDAPLAQDLRVEIQLMLQAGQSNEEIKTFLVDRYGEFVLYRPAVGGNTLVLWLLPAALLLIGAGALMVAIRKRSQLSVDAGEEELD